VFLNKLKIMRRYL